MATAAEIVENRMQADKEERKANERRNFLKDRHAEVEAWTPQQVVENAQKFQRDYAYEIEVLGTDGYSARSDMLRDAYSNPLYMAELEKVVPALVEQANAEDERALKAAGENPENQLADLHKLVDTAKSWAPEEAAKQATLDASLLPALDEGLSRNRLRNEMAIRTEQSPEYLSSLQKNEPAAWQEVKFAAGIPMETMPGITMIYDNESGKASAYIMKNEDLVREVFDNKEAIARFAKNNDLAPWEIKTLNEIDTLADNLQEAKHTRGIQMESLPGKVMIYNNEPGHAGAEIIDREGGRLSFGGKEAIDRYAAENNLSAKDVKTLKEMDARADKFRTVLPTVELDSTALENVANARTRDSDAARVAMGMGVAGAALEGTQTPKVQTAEQAAQNQIEPSETTLTKLQKLQSANMRDDEDKILIPVAIEKRYLVAEGNLHDRNTNALAIELREKQFVAHKEDPATVSTVVEMAQHRGWDSITVNGSDDFKRQVWLEASSKGLEVLGYEPRPVDVAKLAEVMEALAKDKPKNTIAEATPAKAKDVPAVEPKPQAVPVGKDLASAKALTIETMAAGMKAKNWPADKIQQARELAQKSMDKAFDVKPPQVYDAKAPKAPTTIAAPQVQQKHAEPSR